MPNERRGMIFDILFYRITRMIVFLVGAREIKGIAIVLFVMAH